MVVYLILAVILIVLWPSDALAWGPGTHLEASLALLKDAVRFSPLVAPLIKRFRDEFIYGMVSPDVLVGKKYAGALHHCHNWKIGREILNRCKSDRQRASAYGYLAHLACDIVAHNYYIPYMVISSFDGRMRNHTYWELRFDVHVPPSVWQEVRKVIDGDFGEFDAILDRTLLRPIFSFRTNKRIFRTILLIQKFRQIRRTVEIHSKFSQWPLDASEVAHYKNLIMKMARTFLVDLDGAACIKGDPAGLPRLKYANEMRRVLKRFKARGLLGNGEISNFIGRIKEELKKNMLNSEAKLPESYEIL